MPLLSTVMVIWLLLACRLFAATVDISGERLEYLSADAKAVIAKMENQEPAIVLKHATKLTKKHPENVELWMIVGSLEATLGEYDKAVAALEKGVRGQASDVPFFLLIARISEDRAQLGPGGVRREGMVEFRPNDPKRPREDETTFKARQERIAAEQYRRALALKPRVKPYQVKRVELLLRAGDVREALTEGRGYLKENPDEAGLWLQVAKAAVELKQWTEAQEAAEKCLTLRRTDSEVYQVLAQCAAQAGRAEEAEAWKRQVQFYAFVPSFVEASYTQENYDRLRPLLIPRNPEATEKQNRDWVEAAKAAIDALLHDKSEDSTHLLGAIAWRHEWHGRVEDTIYRELEARRAEAMLVVLFARANSYCTMGSCGPALARLRSEAAFPLIVERLPADRNMFSMNIPEALAIYGRPEAVAPLGQALAEARQQAARVRGSVDAMMGGFGVNYFIERSIWALSCFKTPEAKGVLQDVAQDKAWRLHATAALFAQSGERAYFDALMQQLQRNPAEAESIASRFRANELPEAAQVEALVPSKKS